MSKRGGAGASRQPAGVRGTADERARWQAAAEREGRSFASWARGILDRAAAGDLGGEHPPDVAEALDRLAARYMVPPSTAAAMAIRAVDRLIALGRDPFSAPEGEPEELAPRRKRKT